MPTKRIKYLLCFLVASYTVVAQDSTIIWHGDMCKYESGFDNSRYSMEEIEGAYFISKRQNYMLSYTAVLATYHLNFINLEKLRLDYEKKKGIMDTLQLPKNEMYEFFRSEILNELDQVYDKVHAIYQFHINDDISFMRNLADTDSCRSKFIPPLESKGEELLDAWDKLMHEVYKENSNDSWKVRYEKRLASKDKYLYARIFVSSIGWSNCANKQITYFDEHHAFDEFQKLLTKTKELICDGQ